MFDFFFILISITLEFLCQHNMLEFLENHAHVTIDHCSVVCAVIAVFTLCYVMTSMRNILVE